MSRGGALRASCPHPEIPEKHPTSNPDLCFWAAAAQILKVHKGQVRALGVKVWILRPGKDRRERETSPLAENYSAAIAAASLPNSPAYLVIPTIVNTLVKCGESPKANTF